MMYCLQFTSYDQDHNPIYSNTGNPLPYDIVKSWVDEYNKTYGINSSWYKNTQKKAYLVHKCVPYEEKALDAVKKEV